MTPLSEALQEARGSLGTVRNAVLLLGLLGEGPAYQHLTDLAERSGLSVPTVHRLLRSLVLADLAEQDPRSSRYGLGPELVRLSHRYLGRLPVLGALAPFLVQLRDQVGATVHVQGLTRSGIVDLDRVDGSEAGLYRDAHQVRPALSCASGRLLAARGDDEQWKAWLAEAGEPVQELAERDREEWAHADYLVCPGSEAGAPDEVAVPVHDTGAPVPVALAANLPPATGPAELATVVEHLTRAAHAAARTLGHA
ncbi:MAG TPA: helix-turn-helix domain-containing protein [Candidatus Lustribacter sp.]|nr:helix-turn-helix domain-containing protein [Candidatus Lustribacter sp.]